MVPKCCAKRAQKNAKRAQNSAKSRKNKKCTTCVPFMGQCAHVFASLQFPQQKTKVYLRNVVHRKSATLAFGNPAQFFFALSPCPLLGHHQKIHSRGQEVKPPKEQNTDTKKKQSTARLEVLTPGSDMFCRKEKDKTFAQCLTKKSFCQVHFGYACPWLFALWVCHFFLHEQFSPCSCATDNDRLPFPCPQHAIVGWPQ